MTKGRGLILLAEDNPSDADLMLASLRKDGFTGAIQLVHDGVETLDFVFARGEYSDRDPALSPRVILLDVKLPKVDGFEVLRELKSNSRTSSIPVVMFTSSNIGSDVARAYQLGANSYVQKPVDFERFRQTVRELGLYWMTMNEAAPAHSVPETPPR
jgi:two-component system response regulator